MYFSINATNFLDDIYRLKKNETWELQKDYKNFDLKGDMLFSSVHDAKKWLDARNKVIISEKSVEVSPSSFVMGDEKHFDFEFICHRINKPKHMFTYKEFIDAIRKANDSYNNSLQITFNGEVIVKQLADNEIPINEYNYAVREETFCAHNEYVGNINEGEFYEELFHSLLVGWLDHLGTGMSIYNDIDTSKLSEEELIDKIQKIYDKYDI